MAPRPSVARRTRAPARYVLALAFAIAAGGCLSGPASTEAGRPAGAEPSGIDVAPPQATDSHQPYGDPNPTSAPEGPAEEDAARAGVAPLEPVEFTGFLAAPDHSYPEGDRCAYSVVGYTGFTRGTTWVIIDLGRDYSNWSFAFDVRGMVAQFGSLAGAEARGIVPYYSNSVLVCSHGAVATEFTLRLTPPGAERYHGQILAPAATWPVERACVGYGAIYDITLGQASTVRFDLDGDRSGWSFRLDPKGLVADFYGGLQHGPGTAEGLVPDRSTSVRVCSTTAVDTGFQLTLVPPA